MSSSSHSTSTIAVFTSARSDLAPLSPVISALDSVPGIDVIVIATGGHLLKSHGSTIDAIEVSPAQLEMIETHLPDSNPTTITNALALITQGVGEIIARRGVDVLVVLGDRWELLGATSAALIAGTSIAHLHGGEVSSGAIDDRIRHAISKLSDVHCCATEESARRLRQIGEPDDRIVVTGAPGLDRHIGFERLSDEDLSKFLGAKITRPLGLVTYHPETADRSAVREKARVVFETASRALGTMIATYPGVDPGADEVIEVLTDVASRNANMIICPHLGREFSAILASVDVMIGNSSSGIWEAASFKLPVVDIGSRQAGRQRPTNVLHCDYGPEELDSTVRSALNHLFREGLEQLRNPYGDGQSATRIVRCILDLLGRPQTTKQFIDR